MIFFTTKKWPTFLNHWEISKEYCSGIMNIYFIPDRLKQKRLSGIPWHGLGLHKMLNIDYLYSTCHVCQMTKKERKKYGMLPPKIAESDHHSLGHGICGSGGLIYNKDINQYTLSACTHNDRSSHWSVWNYWKAQISQQHPSRICLIISGWHDTRNLNLLSLTMGVLANSNLSSSKCLILQLWH
jgi:hypothetical protein